MSTMTMRNMDIGDFNVTQVRGVFMDLFCTSRNSLENPQLRASGPEVRSFCVLDEGDLDGAEGYWVEDDETGEVGSVPTFEDVFWLHDEVADAWASRPFRGRSMRRGQSGKGGKGRGRSGFRRFRSRKGSSKGKSRPKGRSKGRAHVAETDDDAFATKGKGKGTGQGRAKGKTSKGPSPDVAADIAQSSLPDAPPVASGHPVSARVVARLLPR